MGQKKNPINEIEILFSSYLQSVRKYVLNGLGDREKLEAYVALLSKHKDAIAGAHDVAAEYTEALHHVEIQLANLKGSLMRAQAEAEPKEQTLEFEFTQH